MIPGVWKSHALSLFWLDNDNGHYASTSFASTVVLDNDNGHHASTSSDTTMLMGRDNTTSSTLNNAALQHWQSQRNIITMKNTGILGKYMHYWWHLLCLRWVDASTISMVATAHVHACIVVIHLCIGHIKSYYSQCSMIWTMVDIANTLNMVACTTTICMAQYGACDSW